MRSEHSSIEESNFDAPLPKKILIGCRWMADFVSLGEYGFQQQKIRTFTGADFL